MKKSTKFIKKRLGIVYWILSMVQCFKKIVSSTSKLIHLLFIDSYKCKQDMGRQLLLIVKIRQVIKNMATVLLYYNN